MAFFVFPEDARRNAERAAVEFGIAIGEYEGVVRVGRRIFQNMVAGSPTPERCVEAYHLNRVRLERIAERKLRQRQLTEDANRRDHRPRSPRREAGDPFTLERTVAASSGLMINEAKRRFPVRVRVAVPAGGFGQRLTAIHEWLDENCGADGWTMTLSGLRGVVNDAVAIYFADAQHAAAFVTRWCRHAMPETDQGAFLVREDDPERRERAVEHAAR